MNFLETNFKSFSLYFLYLHYLGIDEPSFERCLFSIRKLIFFVYIHKLSKIHGYKERVSLDDHVHMHFDDVNKPDLKQSRSLSILEGFPVTPTISTISRLHGTQL